MCEEDSSGDEGDAVEVEAHCMTRKVIRQVDCTGSDYNYSLLIKLVSGGRQVYQ